MMSSAAVSFFAVDEVVVCVIVLIWLYTNVFKQVSRKVSDHTEIKVLSTKCFHFKN